MCGINGFTNLFYGRQDIDLMNHVSKNRGPDGTYKFSDKKVTLGHNLLSISGFQPQPFKSRLGNILLYNGEIFNVENDTSYLASMLDFYGIDYLKNVDGNFSIVWYEPEKQKITLVRDHYGTKPLFYIYNDTGLAFSSSLKALNSIVDFTRNDALYETIKKDVKLVKFQTPLTYYTDVKKVMSGQYLTFDLNTNKLLTKGWLFDFKLENSLLNDTEIKNKIKTTIMNVCTTDKQLALLLSGGLDSNVILSQIKDSGVITATSGNIMDEELENASCSASYYNVSNFQDVLDDELLDNYKHSMVDSLYTPIYDYNRLLPRYMAFRRCYLNNVKVVVTGDGGDEIFIGYYKDKQLLDKKNWIDHEKMKDILLEKYQDFPTHVLGSDFINNYKFASLVVNDSINFINDAFASAFSMEVRSPYYLQSLVKTMLNIPGEQKFKITHKEIPIEISKYYLRQLFKDDLPNFVTNKVKKAGWNAQYNRNTMMDFIDMSTIIDGIINKC